ncbi:ATP-binding protein [Bacteroides neonati]|uniref:ATP-binding protein n=1 Tax=Bacteroides neonati TaxID=1347393 RepID=UPI0004BB6CA0|nr:ATP-binding protein [Bacteroides neonati]MCP3893137.1 response regulator [Bacteroides sp.]
MMIEIATVVLCVALIVALGIERSKRLKTRKNLDQETGELKKANTVTRAVLKNVHAYVLLIDSDLKVLATNYYSRTETIETSAEKRIGDLLRCSNALSAEGGCGSHVMCQTCPVRQMLNQSFEQKSSFIDFEASLTIQVSEKESKVHDAQLSGAYLLINDKPHLVITIHDITRLKHTEEALQEAKEKAEHADRSKSAFLANMSHEIRTPLNAIVGFSELLVVAKTDEEKRQYLEIVKTNNELLLQLVNDILDISKIEAGTLEFVYSDVDINLLMSDLEQLFSMKVSEMGVQTKIVRDTVSSPCTMYTDRNRLAQVISNFISNAIKFTPDGIVRFGWELRSGSLYFYVTDNGAGIPKERVSTVFDRFVKLEKGQNGTGLGLSICRTIVEKLGGKLGVESVLGTGSTFWFMIPFQPKVKPKAISEKQVETTVNDVVEATDNHKPSEGKKTILIAEDMEDNYRLCEVILSGTYHLLWAHNGEEVVSLFLQQQPDLILMDLRMPEVDGYEATAAIRQLSSSIPIIALTAFAYPEDRKRAAESGFTDFMTKPVSAKLLLERLASLLS